jgi:hypothetical protein
MAAPWAAREKDLKDPKDPKEARTDGTDYDYHYEHAREYTRA